MPIETTTLLLSILVALAVGIVVGWQLSTVENVFTQPNLKIVVGILVTIMWVTSIAAEILIATYTVSVLVHGIMGAIVGYLFSEDGVTFNIGGE